MEILYWIFLDVSNSKKITIKSCLQDLTNAKYHLKSKIYFKTFDRLCLLFHTTVFNIFETFSLSH